MAVNGEVGCHAIKEEAVDGKEDLQKFDAVYPYLQNDLASLWQEREDVNDAINWFKAVSRSI